MIWLQYNAINENISNYINGFEFKPQREKFKDSLDIKIRNYVTGVCVCRE